MKKEVFSAAVLNSWSIVLDLFDFIPNSELIVEVILVVVLNLEF